MAKSTQLFQTGFVKEKSLAEAYHGLDIGWNKNLTQTLQIILAII